MGPKMPQNEKIDELYQLMAETCGEGQPFAERTGSILILVGGNLHKLARGHASPRQRSAFYEETAKLLDEIAEVIRSAAADLRKEPAQ